MLTVKEILAGVGSCRLAFPTDLTLTFSSVTIDSRQAAVGSLFVALRGARDGHDFIADAYRRGAVGVLADRLVPLDWLPKEARARFAYVLTDDSLAGLQRLATHRRSQHRVRVVGVTGSVGKTTTKEITASILSCQYQVLKNEGNLNNQIGLPLTLLRLEDRHEVAVLEMAMYAPGDIAELCRFASPEIGVVTNVGPSHLERLGSIDRTTKAKAELVESIPADGWTVLNGDDRRVSGMRDLSSAPVMTFGLGTGNDVRAESVIGRGMDGLAFSLRHGTTSTDLTTPLVGKPGIYAALAGAAVARCFGLDLTTVADGLSRIRPTLRLSRLPGRNGSTIIDDAYNASPASMLAALEVLAELPGRRLAILGDMLELGSFEESGHREVGRRAAEVLDGLIVVGPRARSIGEESVANGLTAVEFAANVDAVFLDPRAGDVILVKGSRSMQLETLVTRLRAESKQIEPGTMT